MTELIPMPEPAEEDKKFWDFCEQLEARWEQKIKESMLLTATQLEEGKHEHPDR